MMDTPYLMIPLIPFELHFYIKVGKVPDDGYSLLDNPIPFELLNVKKDGTIFF